MTLWWPGRKTNMIWILPIGFPMALGGLSTWENQHIPHLAVEVRRQVALAEEAQQRGTLWKLLRLRGAKRTLGEKRPMESNGYEWCIHVYIYIWVSNSCFMEFYGIEVLMQMVMYRNVYGWWIDDGCIDTNIQLRKWMIHGESQWHLITVCHRWTPETLVEHSTTPLLEVLIEECRASEQAKPTPETIPNDSQFGCFHKWGIPNSWMADNGKSIYKWMI